MSFRRHLALACLIFFTIGWTAAVLGPVLPDLAQQTHGSLTTIGGVISALFVGALIAQVVSGPLHDRWGIRPLLTGGLALLMVGLIGMVVSHSVVVTLLCGVIAGLGHGTVDIGISLFIALSFETASVAALNFTNVFFGVGAIAGPAAASASLQQWHTALPALWVVSVIAFVAFMLVRVMPLPTAPALPSPPAHVASPARSGGTSLLLWIIGSIFLLYVGLETGIGSWTAEFAHRTAGQSVATGALVAAGFWLALTGGRVLGTIGGTRLTPKRLLALCAGGAVCGGMLLVFSAFHGSLLIPAILVLGVSFGPIYPTAVVFTTTCFAHAPGKAASIVTSLGSVGGVLFPWLQGWLLIQVSPWSSAVFVAFLVGGMGLAILSVVTRQPLPSQPHPSRRADDGMNLVRAGESTT